MIDFALSMLCVGGAFLCFGGGVWLIIRSGIVGLTVQIAPMAFPKFFESQAKKNEPKFMATDGTVGTWKEVAAREAETFGGKSKQSTWGH